MPKTGRHGGTNDAQRLYANNNGNTTPLFSCSFAVALNPHFDVLRNNSPARRELLGPVGSTDPTLNIVVEAN